jgi:hypothetical protein
MILCDTRAVADSPEAAAGRLKLADRALAEGAGVVAEAMLGKLFAAATVSKHAALVEQTRQVMLRTSPIGIAAALRGMAERPDVSGRLAELDLPALVICGAHDAIAPPAEMRGIAEELPQARFVEIKDAGHMSPLEQPDAVNAALARIPSVVLTLRVNFISRADAAPGQLEDRLALDDGTVVRKSVKGLDQQAAAASFRIDVAHRSQGNPAARIESVHQALPLAIGGQFFLEGPENLRGDGFELEAGVIDDSAAAFDAVAALALQPIRKQSAALRQRMLGGGGDFGQREPAIPPGDYVPCRGDFQPGREFAAFDRFRLVDLEQFRMERPAK